MVVQQFYMGGLTTPPEGEPYYKVTMQDSFVLMGRVYSKDQFFYIPVDSEMFDSTKDLNGDSWINFSSEYQTEHYGSVKFKVEKVVPDEVKLKAFEDAVENKPAPKTRGRKPATT